MLQVVTKPEFRKLLSVNFFKKGDRNTSGMLEFSTVEEACDSLMICNHSVVSSTHDRIPFILRLAFSNSNVVPEHCLPTKCDDSSSTLNGWQNSGNSNKNCTSNDHSIVSDASDTRVIN
nr:heterogeneous nuclear ribonucleoprotein l [Hymenolepis microstoma]